MSETRVRLPDGSYVKVPTSDPQVAAAAAQKYYRAKVDNRERGITDKVGDFVDTAMDSLLPNWGDEIRGAGRAIRAAFKGEDTAAAFREGQRSFKADKARFARVNPVASATAKTTGTVAGVALPAGRALRGATMVQKARQGAAVGAVYGGIAGAGEGEGLDLGRRASNAAISAGTGAAAGAALPFAARGAQSAGRWARTNVPGVDRAARTLAAVPQAVTRRLTGRAAAEAGPTAAEAQAHRVLGQQMASGTIDRGMGRTGPVSTPAAIAQEVQRRNEQGVPAMIGDVTENLRGATEYASRGIGPGQSLVRAALDRRKATEAARVRQHVQDTFPTTQDPLSYVNNARREAQAAAGPLYREAYSQPMFRTEAIQGIEQTPAFRQALPQAYSNIRNQLGPDGRPLSPQAMGFREMGQVDPNGLPPDFPAFQAEDGRWIAWDRGLSTEGYDQVVRAMQASGRQAAEVNPLTGAIRNTTNSIHINDRAGDLRRHLMDQNDPYRRAVEGYGDDMSHINAFQQGGDVGKLTGHEINAQRAANPPATQQAWMTGAGTSMADEASRYGAKYPTGNTANHVRQMLGDDVKQGAIEGMNGNNGATRELLDRLESENQANLTWSGTYGNSRTAQRQQLDQDLDTAIGIPTSKEGVVTRLVQFVAQRAAPQFQQDVKRRIAEVVTASNAQTVEEALQAIGRQADLDREFGDLLHRAGVATSAAYGMNVKPTYDTQEP